MYTIKNISLNEVFKKYNTNNLRTLTEDDIVNICRQFCIIEVRRSDPKTGKPLGLLKSETVQKIEDTLTFSDYMPFDSWTESQKKIADEITLFESLTKHSSGKETFKLFADYNLGFYNLKPGDTQSLDVTYRWIRDELLKKPIARYVEIKDGEGNIIQKDAEEKKETVKEEASIDKVAADNLNTMKFADLQKVAKAKGMKTVVGSTKPQLISFIMAS
jgi:hypothetical protein